MSNTITVVGNLTRDPELRFTQSGTAVVSFSIASNRRKRNGDEWEDVTSFFNCTAWDQFAENIAASLSKGDRVLAQGYMEQRQWEDKEGNQRTSMDLTVNELGAELRFATVEVSRASRTSGGESRRASTRDDEEPF